MSTSKPSFDKRGKVSLDPERGREIRERIMGFLIEQGGYLRKKVAISSQMYRGRLIDEVIWRHLDLKVTRAGLWAFSLLKGEEEPDFDLPSRWELGDHILTYLVWRELRQEGGEYYPFLTRSIYVQIFDYPLVRQLSPRKDWEDFLSAGGSLLLTYGEDRILQRWQQNTEDLLHSSPSQAMWSLKRMTQIFEFLFELFWEREKIHLFLLFFRYYKGLFPSEQEKREFFTLLPWDQRSRSHRQGEMEMEFEKLFDLPRRLEEIVESLSQKHPLEQNSSEKLFIERYHRL